MGTILLIIDEEPFIELVGQMNQALEPGGFLITRDVLSKGDDNVIKDFPKSYSRNYRSVTAYENTFEKIGFKLVEKVDLVPLVTQTLDWASKDDVEAVRWYRMSAEQGYRCPGQSLRH
jgi:hypothetical protein